MKAEGIGDSEYRYYMRKMAMDGYCVNLDLSDAAQVSHPSSPMQQQPEPVRKTRQSAEASMRRISGICRSGWMNSGDAEADPEEAF